MEIFRGTQVKPLRVVIYGPEGIGKTTFADKFPAPLFIDTENSTDHIDVARYPKPRSWSMLLEEVEDTGRQVGSFSTLVIDTADWAEALCKVHVVSKAHVNGIEDFGYGKGYVYVAEEWGKLLNKLTELRDLGMNIVMTAHAAMRKFEQPDETGSYDRWELKLEKRDAQMTKEWADMLLFANYEVHAVKTSDAKGAKAKAQGGRRVMYTTHHPCWDAKNRQGLPEKLPFDFGQIAHCLPGTEKKEAPEEPRAVDDDLPFYDSSESAGPEGELPPELPRALAQLMAESGVTDQQLRAVIAGKGYYTADTPWAVMERDGFVDGWVIAFWDKILEMIKGGYSA